MSLDSILDISIENTTAFTTIAGFGVPLILGYHTKWQERVRTYSSLSSILADGFTMTDPEYLAAAAVFAQNPRLPSLMIGRRLGAPVQTYDLTPTNTTEGYIYKITINGEEATYTVQAGDTVELICDGLVLAINALTVAVTATDNTTKVTVVADVAGTWFNYIVGGLEGDYALNIKEVTTDPVISIATDIADMITASNAWYGLILTSHGALEIAAASSYIETTKKLLFAATSDSDVKGSGSTDIISVLKTASRARTSVIYSENIGSFPEAAWVGKMFPKDPGSATWAYKQLSGVSASDLSDTEIGNLDLKNGNYYIDYGSPVTLFGKVAVGEYIDIARGLDWLRARISESLFALLLSSDKVPYTDLGITMVKNAVLGPMLIAETNGLLVVESSVVVAPAADEVSSADKANRLLPNVEFSAVLAGAIHKVTVRGKVSV